MALRHAVIVLSFVLASTAANAQTFAGDWTGVYTGSTSGCTPDVHFGAAAGFTITQSGSAISGTATLQGVIDNCKAIPARVETALFT